jgi:DNA-binding winged helix-turn-helix (wHTH) protein
MAELYARALEEGTETDYVREAIRRLRIEPEGPGRGRGVAVRGEGVHARAVRRISGEAGGLRREAQRRPLELLQALAALGGREVREDQLADALWPESEGDAAQRALTTNLRRLRKLLGSERAITVADRKVSFSSRVVWLDVWALQAVFEKIEARLGKGDPCPPEEAHRLSGRLLGAYRGAFPAGEVDRPWAVPMRERLRSRFVTCLGRLGRLLENEGRFEEGSGPIRDEAMGVDTNFVFHENRDVRTRNVTVSLDEEVALWARLEAARRDTSVSRLLGDLLRERMTREKRYETAMRTALERGPFLKTDGRYLRRDEVHDRARLR